MAGFGHRGVRVGMRYDRGEDAGLVSRRYPLHHFSLYSGMQKLSGPRGLGTRFMASLIFLPSRAS